MRKYLMCLMLLSIFCLSVNTSFGAIAVAIDDVDVLPGATNASVGINLTGISSGTPIDSITFDLVPVTGLTFTGASFGTLPSGFSASQNLAMWRFGATQFTTGGSIVDDLSPFATLSFDIDPAFSLVGNSFSLDYAFYEIADPMFQTYTDVTLKNGSISVVPLPPAILLLGGGLVGLVGLRRKVRS